jgi:putative ABC transport system substrate-binding protein
MRALAQELVGLQPDIILAFGGVATVAVQRETRTIPIVFTSVVDPVASGIVARLDRPGGNTTGFGGLEASMGAKWLELLSEIAPGLKRAAIMFNADTPAQVSTYMPSLETAARSLKVDPTTAPVRSDAEIEAAIIALAREQGGGLVVISDAFTIPHRAPITSAAARNNVPAVYGISLFARDGCLLSYATEGLAINRRAAAYVDRILGGAKPGDLPAQFPVKYEMVIISRPPRRSASPSPKRCWPPLMRSFNSVPAGWLSTATAPRSGSRAGSLSFQFGRRCGSGFTPCAVRAMALAGRRATGPRSISPGEGSFSMTHRASAPHWCACCRGSSVQSDL